MSQFAYCAANGGGIISNGNIIYRQSIEVVHHGVENIRAQSVEVGLQVLVHGDSHTVRTFLQLIIGFGPLLNSDGDRKSPGLVILSTVPGEADFPRTDVKLLEVVPVGIIQRFIVFANSTGVILDGHIVKAEALIGTLHHGVINGFLHGVIVDALVLVVDDPNGISAIFTRGVLLPEVSIPLVGDGDSALSAGTVVGIVLPVGDTDVPSAFRDGGVGQPRDLAALQRNPSFTDITQRASRSSRIILDVHIVHGQIVRRGVCYHFVPNGLPQLVIVYRAVGVVG